MPAQRELQQATADFRHDQRADQAVVEAQRVPAVKVGLPERSAPGVQPRSPVVEMARTK